jgi:hypothetical protein
MLATGINAGVVAVVGFLVAWFGRGRFDAIGRRLDAMEHRFDGRFDGVDRRFEGIEERFEARMDGLQASMDAMRSDLTQVALAVGTRPRAADR